MPTSALVLLIARLFLFVREVGTNAGRWVEAILRVGSAKKGDPWCACFVSVVLGIAFAGKSPLPLTASCDDLLEAARANGWLTDAPVPGDVGLVLKSPTDAEHTFFVTAVREHEVDTIEGNTNPAGGRDGYGVFEREGAHARPRGPHLTFIHYPRPVA